MANRNILIIAFIFIFSHCFSQPGPPAPGCWPPPCVPVDGGISLFAFLSLLFGYKFLSKNK